MTEKHPKIQIHQTLASQTYHHPKNTQGHYTSPPGRRPNQTAHLISTQHQRAHLATHQRAHFITDLGNMPPPLKLLQAKQGQGTSTPTFSQAEQGQGTSTPTSSQAEQGQGTFTLTSSQAAQGQTGQSSPHGLQVPNAYEAEILIMRFQLSFYTTS